jgi:hypothetical protein
MNKNYSIFVFVLFNTFVVKFAQTFGSVVCFYIKFYLDVLQ